MASGGVKLKLNPRNVYRILMFDGVQVAVNEYADKVQRAAINNTEGGLGDVIADEEITGKGYRKRRTARVINTHPLAWVDEFGSYGGERSYAIDSRGPNPGFVDTPSPSRMQRSTGRRTGVVGPRYSLIRAAFNIVGYKPSKARGLS